MAADNYDSIILNGKSLRPAPFVSTSYEYAKSGNYTIGGVLVVTLSGTIVSEDIQAKLAELLALQAGTDCVSLTIGCSRGTDFLNGAGRIRSVDTNQGDQPFFASYTIVIAIEIVDGQPAVKPDDEFLQSIGVTADVLPTSIQQYSENITLNGSGDIMSANDAGMVVSKSYLKASGTINMKVNTTYICGAPNLNPSDRIDAFLTMRANSLLNGIGTNNPLSSFTAWGKWLDTKSLEIQNNGNVVWQFDVYLREGAGFTPMAFVDINTTDKLEQKTQIKTRNISGSIKGLSLSTGNHLGHKADTNERLNNATTVFNGLDGYLRNGVWPGDAPLLTGEEGSECAPQVCPDYIPPVCYQRISSSVSKSVISGEISFDMEFRDINACQSQEYELEITIDDNFPANIIQEIIIPGRQIKPGQIYARSIIQRIADSVQSVTITVRATLNGCDNDGTKMPRLKACVYEKLNLILNTRYPAFAGWYYKREVENISTYSFSITHERVKCNYII